jgi:glycine/D-amino acid oxidase-like deaminating enzyme
MKYDAIVIGGGFYGAVVAIYLATKRKFPKVLLIEREQSLLLRASYNNQARVHNGYHYPRSFTTAFRSRVNLPRFVADYPQTIKRDFTKLYAIARRNSKVTARQFERFCKQIGASLEPAPPEFGGLFNPRLIEGVYRAEELVFDAGKLRTWAQEDLAKAGVEVCLGRDVKKIELAEGILRVESASKDDGSAWHSGHFVFNCTYSGLNQFSGDYCVTQTALKHEITEMGLLEMPQELCGIGVTVMDGPFFSFMPFPDRGLHTLSHVRYTPHLNWGDKNGLDPLDKLAHYEQASRVDRMMRDVARYVPAIENARYVDSLFEVKTVLMKNEGDDGRPILFERNSVLPNCYSILGGKIDNIYDVLEKLDAESLSLP